MKTKTSLPHRKSIRLPCYDYSQAGHYFITICAQNRLHCFGEIVGSTLCGRPNAPHQMIERWLLELKNKFADVRLDQYVIMPNHIHFIIEKIDKFWLDEPNVNCLAKGDHVGSPLRDVIGWFKTMTTNEYIRNVKQGLYEPFPKRLWQRNYYEHIIRSEDDYAKIADYIRNNPALWSCDSLNDEGTDARPAIRQRLQDLGHATTATT